MGSIAIERSVLRQLRKTADETSSNLKLEVAWVLDRTGSVALLVCW